MRSLIVIACISTVLLARERICEFHPDSVGYLLDGCFGKRLVQSLLSDSSYRAKLQDRYGCGIEIFDDTTNPIQSPNVSITYFTQIWTFTLYNATEWAISYERTFDSKKAAQLIFDSLLPRARRQGRFAGIKDSVYIYARPDGTYLLLGLRRTTMRIALIPARVYNLMR